MSNIHNEQMQLIRNSLLNTIFEPYNLLRNTIMKLPVDQNIVGIQKGLSYLDDGILWIKEVLLNSQLIITEPKKTEDSAELTEEAAVEQNAPDAA